MNLNKYKSQYIEEEGTFKLKIIGTKDIQSQNLTDGVELTMINSKGQIIKERYWFTDKALPRLYRLANCANLSNDELENFTSNNLMGKYITGIIKADDQGLYYNMMRVAPAKLEQFEINEFDEAENIYFERKEAENRQPEFTPNPNDDVPF